MTGKIAGLPQIVRQELNHRLQDGETAADILPWLNALPQVQKLLQRRFEGRPINEQNLSEWRTRGYQSWLARQELMGAVREMTREATELDELAKGDLADKLALVLLARLAQLISNANQEVDEALERKLKLFRELSQEVSRLRRGNHTARKMDMQERQEKERVLTPRELVRQLKINGNHPLVKDFYRRQHPPSTNPELAKLPYTMKEFFELEYEMEQEEEAAERAKEAEKARLMASQGEVKEEDPETPHQQEITPVKDDSACAAFLAIPDPWD